MKKIITVLLVICLVCIFFTGCSKSEAAKAVEEQIKAIGEVTIDKGEQIEAAEKAYALLTGEDKGDVKNFDKLTEAKKQWEEIKAVSDRCDELTKKLDTVFTQYGISAEEINEEYNAISEIVPESETAEGGKYAFFSDVKAKYEEYGKMAEDAIGSACSYVKGFYEVNKDKTLEIEDIGCIAQISNDTQYFLFALKYKENGESKTVYSSARFAGTPSVQTMLSYADNFYSVTPASTNTDAFLKGNVILDVQTVLDKCAE